MVAVISVDAYPFFAFSDLNCHLEDTEIGVFWLLQQMSSQDWCLMNSQCTFLFLTYLNLMNYHHIIKSM